MRRAYFSKQKFIDFMNGNPLAINEKEIQKEIQRALKAWANDADGRAVEELEEEEGLVIHEFWVEYKED